MDTSPRGPRPGTERRRPPQLGLISPRHTARGPLGRAGPRRGGTGADAVSGIFLMFRCLDRSPSVTEAAFSFCARASPVLRSHFIIVKCHSQTLLAQYKIYFRIMYSIYCIVCVWACVCVLHNIRIIIRILIAVKYSRAGWYLAFKTMCHISCYMTQ